MRRHSRSLGKRHGYDPTPVTEGKRTIRRSFASIPHADEQIGEDLCVVGLERLPETRGEKAHLQLDLVDADGKRIAHRLAEAQTTGDRALPHLESPSIVPRCEVVVQNAGAPWAPQVLAPSRGQRVAPEPGHVQRDLPGALAGVEDVQRSLAAGLVHLLQDLSELVGRIDDASVGGHVAEQDDLDALPAPPVLLKHASKRVDVRAARFIIRNDADGRVVALRDLQGSHIVGSILCIHGQNDVARPESQSGGVEDLRPRGGRALAQRDLRPGTKPSLRGDSKLATADAAAIPQQWHWDSTCRSSAAPPRRRTPLPLLAVLPRLLGSLRPPPRAADASACGRPLSWGSARRLHC
eukprot:scaffold2808_cov255-Pinguiococcus_pyrenoidosus.AAC.18